MITDNKLLEILNQIITLVEQNPNDQELGAVIRNEYWSKLRKIKQ